MIEEEKIYKQYMYNYPHKKSYGSIKPISLISLKPEIEKSNSGLYIHIPFCSQRCGYCNLFSLCGINDDLISSYIDTIEKEAVYTSDILKLKIDEFILGGGTPLYLNLNQLERVLSIPKKFFASNLEEVFVGIETSPKDTSFEKLELLKKYKVNRISMGVQSFVDEELKLLNRSHRVLDIENALKEIKKFNFDIVNLDLIYGIENQSLDSFSYSLNKLLEFKPDEVFLYPLYVRDNKNIGSSKISKSEFYKFGRDFLVSNGYVQKSMRQFSLKPNHVSSCGFSNSISLGVGGRSYVGKLHYCHRYSDNQKSIKEIIENYIGKTDFSIIDYGFYLNTDEEKRLFLIKNLFTSSGLNINEYKNIFNSNVLDDFIIIKDWLSDKYFSINNDYIIPSSLGLMLSDYLGPKLISNDVENKMNNWTDVYGK